MKKSVFFSYFNIVLPPENENKNIVLSLSLSFSLFLYVPPHSIIITIISA